MKESIELVTVSTYFLSFMAYLRVKGIQTMMTCGGLVKVKYQVNLPAKDMDGINKKKLKRAEPSRVVHLYRT